MEPHLGAQSELMIGWQLPNKDGHSMHWNLDDERDFLASLSTDNYEDDRGCSEQENASEVLSSFRMFIDNKRKQAKLRKELYDVFTAALAQQVELSDVIKAVIYAAGEGIDLTTALDALGEADYHHDS